MASQKYTVKRGDTLWGIAERFLGNGNRYPEIQKMNGLTGSMIKPGQVLIVKEGTPEPAPAPSVDMKKELDDCLTAIEGLPEFKKLLSHL